MGPLSRKTSKTKAIEPIIASLLLIAIAVAASVITYTWVTNMISQQSSQAQTMMRIEAVSFSKSGTLNNVNNVTTVTVRNTGTVNAKIVTTYFTYANSTQKATSYTTVILPATTSPFIIILDAGKGWVAATNYAIKIVTDNGFYAEGTYTSPSS